MTVIDQRPASARPISRRTVGLLALGAALSACGGGGDSESALGRVSASDWSDALPAYVPTSPVQMGIIAVGASGLIYATSLEGSETVLTRYRPSGAVASQFRLPRGPSPYTQIDVVEDTATGDILMARSAITGVFINTYAAAGGGIYRLNPASGQITAIFESSTVTPSGLARDATGNLYTLDLKTGDVLKLPAGSNQATVLYRVTSEPVAPIGGSAHDFVLSAKGVIAVTSDGTLYATLVAGGHRAGAVYGPYGAKAVRLRNGQADLLDAPGGAFGAWGTSLYYLSNGLLRRLDAAGVVTTVAGTSGVSERTQFGSPGTLSSSAAWIGLTPDGRIHLESRGGAGPRFFDVVLAAED